MSLSRSELETLYTQCAPAVHRRARTLLGRDDEAWDTVQQVFESMMKNSEQFRREASPMTWVYRITTNICLNAIRSRGLREPGAQPAEEPAEERGESQAAGVEARNLLRQWAAHLNEREMHVATLLFIDGLTQDEVAQTLGLSRKTIGREVQVLRVKAQALGALPNEVPGG